MSKHPLAYTEIDKRALELVRSRCSPAVRPEFPYRWDVVQGLPGEVRLRVTALAGEPGAAQTISADASGVISGSIEDLLRRARVALEHVERQVWVLGS